MVCLEPLQRAACGVNDALQAGNMLRAAWQQERIKHFRSQRRDGCGSSSGSGNHNNNNNNKAHT